MFRDLMARWRRDPYDEAYERARTRRMQKERAKAEKMKALRVFANDDADLTTGSLPIIRLERS